MFHSGASSRKDIYSGLITNVLIATIFGAAPSSSGPTSWQLTGMHEHKLGLHGNLNLSTLWEKLELLLAINLLVEGISLTHTFCITCSQWHSCAPDVSQLVVDCCVKALCSATNWSSVSSSGLACNSEYQFSPTKSRNFPHRIYLNQPETRTADRTKAVGKSLTHSFQEPYRRQCSLSNRWTVKML